MATSNQLGNLVTEKLRLNPILKARRLHRTLRYEANHVNSLQSREDSCFILEIMMTLISRKGDPRNRETKESLMVNYSKAMSNVKELESRGCIVLHEVDVHSMSRHPFLISVRFDRIIYNFPHAGYLHGTERNKLQILSHQHLVRGFFENAREMLTGVGEIHVTHKTTIPFSEWKIVELAAMTGIYLVHEEQFSIWDYPGYENKRGAVVCDQTFHIGRCSTFKFARILYPSTAFGFHLGATSSGPSSGYFWN